MHYITDQTSKGNWIGFNDQDQDLEFKWTDNTPVLYAQWDSNSPVRHAGDSKTCVYANQHGKSNELCYLI